MWQTPINQEEMACLRKWWNGLDGNRSDRAQLRRAASPTDILLTPAFSHFLQMIPKSWSTPGKFPISDLAMIAVVLARVKNEPNNSSVSFAKSLARPKEGGAKAVMSELRFQHLQKSRTPEDFYLRMCRAINLLGGNANVASLANDIVLWLHEFRFGPSSKPENRLAIRWATDYYAVYKD